MRADNKFWLRTLPATLIVVPKVSRLAPHLTDNPVRLCLKSLHRGENLTIGMSPAEAKELGEKLIQIASGNEVGIPD